MAPDRIDHLAELERLTGVLTRERDGMEHGESRRFAEILLQETMAKVCAEKCRRMEPAPGRAAA